MISILIPSRLAGIKPGALFLNSALASIRAQTIYGCVPIEIMVGVDAGAVVPQHLGSQHGLSFVHSDTKSQAAALNAASRGITGETVAILEDDDTWHPRYLEIALEGLKQCDFVSSNELEADPAMTVVRINDFPTPSSWVMRRETWDAVGGFDEDYRLHLDNEWLGRLGTKPVTRLHLLDAGAPHQPTPERPQLEFFFQFARPTPSVARHNFSLPLIGRLTHPGSGIESINRDEAARQRSEQELALIQSRFGRIPW